MNKFETDYIKNQLKHTQETRTFFNNSIKPERERSVCRAFLRTIGIDFKDKELIAPTEEPADVAFRDARFQIREILDPGRKRGDEWREKEKKYTEAKSIIEISGPYSSPIPFNLETLVPALVDSLSEKSIKYGNKCHDIDILVYINLSNKSLIPDSEIPDLDKLRLQGWRSASFIFNPYGVVLFANSNAPDFLCSLKPGVYNEWKTDGLFDI